LKNKNDETEWDRRGFLQCMAWVGTGAVWTMTGGILKGMPIEHAARSGAAAGGLRFVQISVDNFSFSPAAATVPAGSLVTWTNRDDIPHNIVSTEKRFASPALDTDQQFSYRFAAPGTFPYYCSLHPKMTGRIVVS
jgi:plastocyanin